MPELPRRTALELTGLLAGASFGVGSVTAAREAGVTVTESDGTTVVDEAGGTDEYTVVLDSQPAADVTVHVEPDEQVATDVDSLTFTPLDWDEPQSVAVSAVDDPDVEADPHRGLITHRAESLDPDYDGIDVRDVTVTVRDDDVPAELEGLLSDVDEEREEIEVLGTTVDVSDAAIHSPTAALSVSDLAGEPLPGRGSTPGFVDGTAAVVGSTAESGGTVHADEVTAIVAENVVVGPVTENTIPSGGSLDDGTLAVQGVVANAIDDERLPLEAVIEGTGGLTVDLGLIAEGTVCALEGYYAQDGNLYTYAVETESGEPPGDQTGVSRRAVDPATSSASRAPPAPPRRRSRSTTPTRGRSWGARRPPTTPRAEWARSSSAGRSRSSPRGRVRSASARRTPTARRPSPTSPERRECRSHGSGGGVPPTPTEATVARLPREQPADLPNYFWLNLYRNLLLFR